MFFADALSTLLSSMSLATALIGVAMSLTQPHNKALFRILGAFFAAIAATELGDAIGQSVAYLSIQVLLEALWIIGATAALPLLWLYIWRLTHDRPSWPSRLWTHAILPAFSILLFVSVFTLPTADQHALFTDIDGSLSNQGYAFGFVYEVFALFIVTIQWLFYLVLSSVRLIRYRLRLKDVFASTEDKELRWTLAIVGLSGTYWFLGFAFLLLEVFGIYESS